jgi:hypothetical protein
LALAACLVFQPAYSEERHGPTATERTEAARPVAEIEARQSAGDIGAARDGYEESVEIYRRWSADSPICTTRRQLVEEVLEMLSQFGDPAPARAALDEASAILERLRKTDGFGLARRQPVDTCKMP